VQGGVLVVDVAGGLAGGHVGHQAAGGLVVKLPGGGVRRPAVRSTERAGRNQPEGGGGRARCASRERTAQDGDGGRWRAEGTRHAGQFGGMSGGGQL